MEKIEEEEATAPKVDYKEREQRKVLEYSLITPDDKSNNRTSLYRKLTENLYLLVKDSDTEKWIFPTVNWEYDYDKNNLRKTADRALDIWQIKKYFEVWWKGNAPIGYFDPNKENRIFYYRSEYINGFIKQEHGIEHLWVSREELKEYFSEKEYKHLCEILPPSQY